MSFKPTAELIADTRVRPNRFGLKDVIDLIEFSGRVDYGPKSLSKLGDRTIIPRWMDMGHESMIEMGHATFFIVCSRVVSHELVRHRLASYQQESQRYVKYEDEEPDDVFFIPPEADQSEALIMVLSYEDALREYRKLRSLGVKSQVARYVLPNATRTRMVMDANFREWGHILRQRCHKSAQPEMQIIAKQILDIMVAEYPEVFKNVQEAIEAEERAVR